MNGWFWAAAACAVVGLVWVATVNLGRVRRLDRLHRRLDAARAGLAAALAGRRDAAEQGVDALQEPGPRVAARSAERDGWLQGAAPGDRTPGRAGPAETMRAAVAGARSAEPDRESAENALGRALARLDRSRLPADLRTGLAEAEVRLVLARRVHNDAVRDTLALRSRRLVRWLHLAGTAPMPMYFEIADPPGVTGPALPARPLR